MLKLAPCPRSLTRFARRDREIGGTECDCAIRKGWYRLVDSNHRPLDPQSSALTN